MAIQGTQVPKYTKHTLFLYFFSIFFLMKNKIKQKLKTNKQKHVNKAKHKTRPTQNKKAKHTSNANKKKGGRDREKND